LPFRLSGEKKRQLAETTMIASQRDFTIDLQTVNEEAPRILQGAASKLLPNNEITTVEWERLERR
jgi:hypothetical protein